MKSRDDRPYAHNSTLRVGRKPLERTPFTGPVGPTRKPRKAIPKANPERQRKAAKRYAVKLAKYRASETCRIVAARADGRCEFACNTSAIPQCVAARYSCFDGWSRCTSSGALEDHHKTYARFGGNELPEDITRVCKAHHEYLESLKAAGNRRSRSSLSRDPR